MRRYAWVTAVCLAALMAGGCGNQAGQETKQNSERQLEQFPQ